MNSIRYLLSLRGGIYFCNYKSFYSSVGQVLTSNEVSKKSLFKIQIPIVTDRRNKYSNKKQSKVEGSDDESDLDEEDYELEDPTAKIITSRLTSLRVDAVLKAGLGLARNKIETLFYENKIFLNGKTIKKKSSKANIRDEIDVIKGSTEDNRLNISRVEIVSVKENENNDGLIVKIKRHKNLTIENPDLL